MATSILRRVWAKLRGPSQFVGKDLEGNKYFEYPNPNDGFGRPKRVVKYRHGYDMWTYIAGDKRLPVQWTSWLTHTRVHPPTLEELHADLVRQERVRLRVEAIKAAERGTGLHISGQTGSTSLPNIPDVPFTDVTAKHGQTISSGIGQLNPGAPLIEQTARPDPALPSQENSSRDEPETWAPQIAPRAK